MTTRAGDGTARGELRRSDFLKRAAVAGAGATGAAAVLAETALAGGKPGPSGPRGPATLGGLLTRIAHVWINVSDVERSVEFYERVVPYVRTARIDGPAQAYRGIGIARGRFEGWVLTGTHDLESGAPTRRIHLVQWIDPAPVGVPYPEANHLGFYRTNNIASGSGLTATHEKVVAAGGRPYGPPSFILINPGGAGVYVFGMRDPDGITLEYSGGLEPDPDSIDQPSHVQLNCRSLPRSYRFYHDVIGLEQSVRLNPDAPQPATNGSLGDLLRNPDGSVNDQGVFDYDASIIGAPADLRHPIDLLEWEIPDGPFGRPYKRPNNLGIMRLAFEVTDIEAARDALLRTEREAIGARGIGPVETWDLGEAGTRRVAVFHDIDGAQLELVERPGRATQGPLPA